MRRHDWETSWVRDDPVRNSRIYYAVCPDCGTLRVCEVGLHSLSIAYQLGDAVVQRLIYEPVCSLLTLIYGETYALAEKRV